MLDILRSIVDIISSAVSFFVHQLESTYNLITHIPQYVSFMATSINVLPSVIIPFAMASITIYVVFLILGRG